MGRAVGSPHKTKTDDDREFGRSWVPTLSLDHCFLGIAADEESAHTNPFLIIYDADTAAIYSVAVPDKSVRPWIVEYLFMVINELGYECVKIAIKIDGAPELKELRRLVSAKRIQPTIPLDVPVRDSNGNGAVERAVRTWTGQFRTIKSHLESEIGTEIDKKHPILQCLAWWAALILCRIPVKSHGRTVFEYITGHRMKALISCSGEALLWRKNRHSGELNKLDSEGSDGVFLGISAMTTYALIGTADGIIRTRDYRMAPEGRFNKKLLLDVCTSFEQYIVPTVVDAEVVVIDGAGMPLKPLAPAENMRARRLRLSRDDIIAHGYTAGCGGCVALQRNLSTAWNYTEVCRARMEAEIEKTLDGS